MFGKYPILGVGTDNLQHAVIENLTDEGMKVIERFHAIPDKAHNEYLQIAATLGIPALILYMTFLCMIILPKLKDLFKNNYIFLMLCIIGSYLVQAFFNISTIGIAPLFWFALGIIDNEEINKEVLEQRSK